VASSRLGYSKRVSPPAPIAVLLDSNTLIMLASGRVAPSMIDSAIGFRYKLYVTDKVLSELEALAKSHPKQSTRRLAAAAISLSKKLGVEIVRVEAGDADDSLEAAARALRTSHRRVVVATSDRTLRRRLRRLGIPTLYYRESEGVLELDWDLD
jgi:rRNA-processing protein FCF1